MQRSVGVGFMRDSYRVFHLLASLTEMSMNDLAQVSHGPELIPGLGVPGFIKILKQLEPFKSTICLTVKDYSSILEFM